MTNPSLMDKMPRVRGKLMENVRLSKYTWFRVGGIAEILFWPKDEQDLSEFFANIPSDVPITILGVGSNTLVRDGGIPGVTIRLGKGFQNIEISRGKIKAGAGLSNLKLAKVAKENGLSGLEFLSGIPGSLGGAIRMNAGAFDREISDILISTRTLTIGGGFEELPKRKISFSYRSCNMSESSIFLSANLRVNKGKIGEIESVMKSIRYRRQVQQPSKQATGGSTFINPPGFKAWELIENAGCRGLTIGGAQVSEKHCNFIVNLGSATALDIEKLGNEVKRRVLEHTGIKLEWEIKRIGVHLEEVGRGIVT